MLVNPACVSEIEWECPLSLVVDPLNPLSGGAASIELGITTSWICPALGSTAKVRLPWGVSPLPLLSSSLAQPEIDPPTPTVSITDPTTVLPAASAALTRNSRRFIPASCSCVKRSPPRLFSIRTDFSIGFTIMNSFSCCPLRGCDQIEIDAFSSLHNQISRPDRGDGRP